jgi:hypothetical protein
VPQSARACGDAIRRRPQPPRVSHSTLQTLQKLRAPFPSACVRIVLYRLRVRESSAYVRLVGRPLRRPMDGFFGSGTSQSNSFAVLIRTHAPSAAALSRICAWAAAAERHPLCRLFAVSVDATQPPGQRAAEALRRLLPANALVHSYNEAALGATYPVLETECRARLNGITTSWHRFCQPQDQAVPKYSASLAWGFHAEAINLFVQSCSSPRVAVNGQFDLSWEHLWVLEDDVGFTGDDLVADCLARYCSDPADLISPTCEPVFRLGTGGRALGSNWNWAYMGSDAFLDLVPPQRRVKSAEHVQRFSRRFLDALHRFSTGALHPALSGSHAGSQGASAPMVPAPVPVPLLVSTRTLRSASAAAASQQLLSQPSPPQRLQPPQPPPQPPPQQPPQPPPQPPPPMLLHHHHQQQMLRLQTLQAQQLHHQRHVANGMTYPTVASPPSLPVATSAAAAAAAAAANASAAAAAYYYYSQMGAMPVGGVPPVIAAPAVPNGAVPAPPWGIVPAPPVGALQLAQLPSGIPPGCTPATPPAGAGAVIAWSEMSVPSLALHLGLRVATLAPEHVGHIFSFDGRVTSAEHWGEICRHPACGKRLFHALKF